MKIARAQQALSYFWPSPTGSKRKIAKPEPDSSPISKARARPEPVNSKPVPALDLEYQTAVVSIHDNYCCLPKINITGNVSGNIHGSSSLVIILVLSTKMLKFINSLLINLETPQRYLFSERQLDCAGKRYCMYLSRGSRFFPVWVKSYGAQGMKLLNYGVVYSSINGIFWRVTFNNVDRLLSAFPRTPMYRYMYKHASTHLHTFTLICVNCLCWESKCDWNRKSSANVIFWRRNLPKDPKDVRSTPRKKFLDSIMSNIYERFVTRKSRRAWKVILHSYSIRKKRLSLSRFNLRLAFGRSVHRSFFPVSKSKQKKPRPNRFFASARIGSFEIEMKSFRGFFGQLAPRHWAK